MSWQSHEVWIQVLLFVLMGQQGPGEGRPEGLSPTPVASPTPGFGGRSTPSPREGTVEMVLIQCLNPSWSGLW